MQKKLLDYYYISTYIEVAIKMFTYVVLNKKKWNQFNFWERFLCDQKAPSCIMDIDDGFFSFTRLWGSTLYKYFQLTFYEMSRYSDFRFPQLKPNQAEGIRYKLP